MRPLRLKMQAFGPFAKEQELDFGVLGDRGLFLVHGRTGAGKTTILDAICFALYGESSGKEREGRQLRSDFSAADLPTEIGLDFSHGGEFYRIVRRPAQEQPKKRGDGVTIAPPTVTFSRMSEGGEGLEVLNTKVGEVAERVAEIIGLRAEQFRQVIMIPQGQFRKLLVADAKDREQILRTLFQTGRFGAIQDALKLKAKDLTAAMEDVERRRSILLEQVEVENVEVLQAKIETLVTEEKSAQEAHQSASAALKKSAGMKAQLEGVVEVAQRVNRIAKALAMSKAKVVSTRETAQLKVTELAKCEEELQPRLAEINGEVARLKKLEPEVKRFTDAVVSLEKLKEEVAGNALYREKVMDSISKVEMELEKQTIETSELLKKVGGLEGAKLRVSNAEVGLKSLTEIRKQEGKIFELGAVLEGIKADGIQKAEGLKKAELERDALYQQWKDGRAASLAGTLQEDAPCPVCGSEHHPSPASSAETIPTDDALASADSVVTTAQKKVEEMRLKFADTRKDQSTATQLRDQLKEQLTVSFPELEKEHELAKEALAAVQTSVELHGKAQEKVEALTVEFKKYKQQLETGQEVLEVAKATEAKQIAVIEELGGQIEEEMREPGAVGKQLRTWTKEQSEISAKLKASDDAKVAAAGTLTTLQAQIEEMSKQLAEEKASYAEKREDEHPEDALRLGDSLEVQLKSIVKVGDAAVIASERASKRMGEVEEQLKAVRKGEELLSKLEEEFSELDGSYRVLGTLSEVANGSKPPKITFQRFVLGVLLEEVVATATKRLFAMSRARYELQRVKGAVDGRSAAGLDLEVYDHYTGISRPVATLSGGESFLAALALALALADVTASYAGGVTMETMFIDEGFGSLDSEALDLAFKTLYELQEGGRLVGVISHVAELQDRIPTRLEVTSTREGSSADFVIS